MSELLSESQAILARVEEVTGTPVEIRHDRALGVMARIAPARHGATTHALTVNDALGQPDYLIAYQCGFLLRQYQHGPNDRKEFAGTEAGREESERLVRRAGQLAHLPDGAKSEIAAQFRDGVLTQLRSYPIGIRIDRWINREYPGLGELQREAIARQQAENQASLKPEIRAMSPRTIFDANAGMNAAYAVFCDREIADGGYSIPFRSVGLEKRGRLLSSLTREDGAQPLTDEQLVDAWANELGLSAWYQWTPAER